MDIKQALQLLSEYVYRGSSAEMDKFVPAYHAVRDYITKLEEEVTRLKQELGQTFLDHMAEVSQLTGQYRNGYKKITDASELVVGQWYWVQLRVIRKNGTEYRGLMEPQEVIDAGDGRTYVGRHMRMWCHPENDQFTGRFVAYGPIPRPEVEAR